MSLHRVGRGSGPYKEYSHRPRNLVLNDQPLGGLIGAVHDLDRL